MQSGVRDQCTHVSAAVGSYPRTTSSPNSLEKSSGCSRVGRSGWRTETREPSPSAGARSAAHAFPDCSNHLQVAPASSDIQWSHTHYEVFIFYPPDVCRRYHDVESATCAGHVVNVPVYASYGPEPDELISVFGVSVGNARSAAPDPSSSRHYPGPEERVGYTCQGKGS